MLPSLAVTAMLRCLHCREAVHEQGETCIRIFGADAKLEAPCSDYFPCIVGDVLPFGGSDTS